MVYALASFLFFSGILRKNVNLLAISLLVTFLYGSMVWGVFPIEKRVSWESHLFGAIVGSVLAYVYRHKGPPPVRPSWEYENDDDEEPDPEDAYWNLPVNDNEPEPNK